MADLVIELKTEQKKKINQLKQLKSPLFMATAAWQL